MKSLIVFTSHHGTTRKAARILGSYIIGDVELLELNKNSTPPDINKYDTIIIGGSIHAGSIQKSITQFIKLNQDILATKKIGLFLCCMREGKIAEEEFQHAYPKNLRDLSIANGLFGGEFIFSKMNFVERQIVKRISGIKEDISNLNVDLIKEFADKLNSKIPLENAIEWQSK
jgi:menaquinone-dependent protoporphyrinogen oxidase